jgi:site-specific DNA-methyltransferase (adenine-specific)
MSYEGRLPQTNFGGDSDFSAASQVPSSLGERLFLSVDIWRVALITTTDCCDVSANGITFHRQPTAEEWQQLGDAIATTQKGLMWIVGDWLLAGESGGYIERGKHKEACERFGIAYQTAKDAAYVCRAFERSCRHYLSFEHHRTVANREDAAELLEWAAENKATVKELREEKQKANMPAVVLDCSQGEKEGSSWHFMKGDCQSIPLEDNSVDLVFCSPPYESQRSYSELEFNLSGDDYVNWAADCFMECLRVCRGVVAWVVEGSTSSFEYSYTPFLIGAEIQRRGAKLRKPVVFQRNGIPGTGGPDWLRNDWEPIICATKNGRLPWSDNTAMGSPPKQNKPRQATNRTKDGSRKNTTYNDPDVCNPGNIIKGLVGSGGLGWKDAHENEAPFPEWLAEFWVKSFCPPGGTVLDPFSGSGTTVAVAVKHGRNGIGIDARDSQIWLAETRLNGLTISERKQGQEPLFNESF